jgi:hypothetical protein
MLPDFSSLSAFAQVGAIVEDENGLNYRILTMPDGGNNGTVEVSDDTSYAGPTVTIPADITVSGSGNDGTYDVVKIGEDAFAWNLAVTTLNLSGATNLTTIGEQAFENCTFTSINSTMQNLNGVHSNAFTYITGTPLTCASELAFSL